MEQDQKRALRLGRERRRVGVRRALSYTTLLPRVHNTLWTPSYDSNLT